MTVGSIMFKHSSLPVWHILILGCVRGVAFFANLGGVPFYDKGEPREALVVRHRLERKLDFAVEAWPADSIEAPLFHRVGAFRRQGLRL